MELSRDSVPILAVVEVAEVRIVFLRKMEDDSRRSDLSVTAGGVLTE